MASSEGAFPQPSVVVFTLECKGKMHQCSSYKLGISHSSVHRVIPESMGPLSAPQHVRQLLDRAKICAELSFPLLPETSTTGTGQFTGKPHRRCWRTDATTTSAICLGSGGRMNSSPKSHFTDELSFIDIYR